MVDKVEGAEAEEVPAEEGGDGAAESGKTTDQGTPQSEKAAEEKAADGTAAEAEDGEKSEAEGSAPVEYEDFSLPEGMDVDQEALGEFTKFAQEHGLSQEAAQSLIDSHVSNIEKFTEAQQERWSEIKESWSKEALADKELQSEEGGSEAAVALAKTAVEKLGGGELQEALELTGAGNHPAVVKAFYKMGKAMAEDKMVFGGTASDTSSKAAKLFPSMKSKG